MNFIDHFDGVRIINVASRTDRQSETISEFKHHGFQINTETVQFFKAVTPQDSGGFPTPGVKGCFLSHLGVLEEASSAGAKNVLVLEDDIQFSSKLRQYGGSLFEQLNEVDWDIAYFGHALDDAKGEAEWKLVEQPMLLAHFYAVNGKTLEKLTTFLHEVLERPPGHPDGGPMHYDGALNTFMDKNSDIKAYYCSLNLGYQRSSKTDLHELSIFDTNPLLRPLVKAGRQIKNKLLKYTR